MRPGSLNDPLAGKGFSHSIRLMASVPVEMSIPGQGP